LIFGSDELAEKWNIYEVPARGNTAASGTNVRAAAFAPGCVHPDNLIVRLWFIADHARGHGTAIGRVRLSASPSVCFHSKEPTNL